MFGKYNIYRTVWKLYHYNDTYFRIVKINGCREKGFEEKNKKINKEIESEDFKKSESLRCSLSRTKRTIREICFCNSFTHFVTLTVSPNSCDRFSVDECEELLRKKIKSYKRNHKNFIYILIAEEHKKGGYHFHGLFGGISSSDLYLNNNGYYSLSHFDDLGFNSISEISDFNKTCNYITKYITKDCVKNSHNQVYICSRGLRRPESYEILPFDFSFDFTNDFCSVSDLYLDKLPSEKKLFLLNNISEIS